MDGDGGPMRVEVRGCRWGRGRAMWKKESRMLKKK